MHEQRLQSVVFELEALRDENEFEQRLQDEILVL